jgi:putative SOS response-associated peptidase YedK
MIPDSSMCNLYSQTKSQDAMRQVFADLLIGDETIEDLTGNLASQTGVYPDYSAPILRHAPQGGWQLTKARWGMPTPQVFLEGKRTDPGVTNIRNVSSPHWRRWLGVENRCLVPFTSFSELDTRAGSPRNHPIWFALEPDRPLAFFAGIHTEWTSVRKLRRARLPPICSASLPVPPMPRWRQSIPKPCPLF